MSTTTITTLACDIRRAHPLADAEGQTVRFSLDGQDYEADLCEGCLSLLTSDLEPFTRAARAVPADCHPHMQAGRPMSRRRYAARVRAWAIAEGLTTQATGTISPRIYARYEAAHRGKS